MAVYLPFAQAVQGAEHSDSCVTQAERDDCAAGPKVPAAHSDPEQLSWLMPVWYVPGLQSMHPPSLYFPGTHVDEHVCAWSAALLRYFPAAQLLSVHGELSAVTEYLPFSHDAQDASADVVPAETPWPAGHEGVLCGLHGRASSVLLYLAAAQFAHDASLALVVPSLYPLPLVHDVVALVEHTDWPVNTVKVPAPQSPHQPVNEEGIDDVV